MKTNVSIKFNSIEEYRVIEQKLEGLGYECWDKKNDNRVLKETGFDAFVAIYPKDMDFGVYDFIDDDEITYNSLEEFLKYE